MVRTYKKKTNRDSYGDNVLEKALQEVNNGTPLLTVSKRYGVPARTLRRHRDKSVTTPGQLKLGRHMPALPEHVENEVCSYIKLMEGSLCCLTTFYIRRLAFGVAKKAGINHPFNENKQMAGKDWLLGFMRRHPDLSLREPQGVSLSRMQGFNRIEVDRFFSAYKGLLDSHQIDAANIWNMDETCITSVQKPCKVIATKGARRVGKLTSGERGTLVTVICAMNSVGVFLPPMFVFPRKRMVSHMMSGSPPLSIGYASPSGWSDSGLFVKWLEHFVAITKSSTANEHVLLLDGHQSHKSLEAIDYARANGIHMLTFPPHSTHRMQPLDVSYFKSLKSAYSSVADNWMVSNRGQKITIYQMAELFGKAYLRTANPLRAINGFRSCGLWPYDPEVFTADQFVCEQDGVDLDTTATQSEGNCTSNQHATPDQPMAGRLQRDEDVNVDPSFATATTECDEEFIGDSSPSAEWHVPYDVSGSPPSAEWHVPDDVSGSPPSAEWHVPDDVSGESVACTTDRTPTDDDNVVATPASEPTHHAKCIKTSGDGRCFFRSIVIAMDDTLQHADRDIHGTILDPILFLSEQTQADAVRCQVVQHMCRNIHEYSDIEESTLNGDMPQHIRYSSIGQRIQAASLPSTMPGEFEIIATSAVLNRPIQVMNNARGLIRKYGDEFDSNTTIYVMFHSFGEDVGHYDALVHDEPSAPRSTTDGTREIERQEAAEIIRSVSGPLRNAFVAQKSRRSESSTVLTSSPYKKQLAEKRTKRLVPRKVKKTQQRKRGGQRRTTAADVNETDCHCIICSDLYSNSAPGERWIQCQICSDWAHLACTPGSKTFVCPACD